MLPGSLAKLNVGTVPPSDVPTYPSSSALPGATQAGTIDTGNSFSLPTPITSRNPNENEDDQFTPYNLLKDVNPIVLGHADAIAEYANRTIASQDLIAAAKRGMSPLERASEIHQQTKLAEQEQEQERLRTQGNPRIEEIRGKINTILDGLGNLKTPGVDTTGLDQAMANYQSQLGHAPTAPSLDKGQLNDNELIASLFAGLLGGGVNQVGNALGAAQKGADMRADQNNKIAMTDYQNRTNDYQQKLSESLNVVRAESNRIDQELRFNQTLTDNQRQAMTAQLRALQNEEEMLLKNDADTAKAETAKQEKNYKQIGDNIKSRMSDAEGWTQEDANELESVILQLIARGYDEQEVRSRLPGFPVGTKTPTAVNAGLNQKKFDLTVDKQKLETLKFEFSKDIQNRKFKLASDRQAWIENWSATKLTEQIRQFEKLTGLKVDALDALNADRAIKNAIAQQNANTKSANSETYTNGTAKPLNEKQKTDLQGKLAKVEADLTKLGDDDSDQGKALKEQRLSLRRQLGLEAGSPMGLKGIGEAMKVISDPKVIKAAGAAKCPPGQASCAYFVSGALQKTGVKVPTTGGAKALIDKVKSSGGQEVSQKDAQPGDLVYYFGPGYGDPQNRNFVENGVKGGYHVAYYLGNGKVIDSSGKPGEGRNTIREGKPLQAGARFIRPNRTTDADYSKNVKKAETIKVKQETKAVESTNSKTTNKPKTKSGRGFK